MYVIGLDAGTTSVSGVLLDTDRGMIVKILSKRHNADIPSTDPETSIQDPAMLSDALAAMKNQLIAEAASLNGGTSPNSGIDALAVTGQVHGILYLDQNGNALGPLYTWQDGRGRRIRPTQEGGLRETWVEWAQRKSGYNLPSGYGLLTHCINIQEGLVSPEAKQITSLLGYISMQLAEATTPRIDSTDAHALGLYAEETGEFDIKAVEKLGIPAQMLPKIVPNNTQIGKTAEGIPVVVSLGDNQAGVIGSVLDINHSILVNVGTSAQLSVYAPEGHVGQQLCMEPRPFPGGGILLSGASLCGGSASGLLEAFFRQVCLEYGGKDPGNIFKRMDSVAIDNLDENLMLDVRTQFRGTRENSEVRGSISGIGMTNFTPDYLVVGFLRGIVAELHDFHASLPEALGTRAKMIVAVGNGIQRNPLIRRILSKAFQLPVLMPEAAEVAALGAAIVAGVAAGTYKDYASTDRPIRYQQETKVENE